MSELQIKLWVNGTTMLQGLRDRALRVMRDVKGQGTTEYAILVGVLVVVAIAAVFLLKPILGRLWDSITEEMMKLDTQG